MPRLAVSSLIAAALVGLAIAAPAATTVDASVKPAATPSVSPSRLNSAARTAQGKLKTAARVEEWDPLNCPHGHPSFPETCWADSAFQECSHDRQAAYDHVMEASNAEGRHERYKDLVHNGAGCTEPHAHHPSNCPFGHPDHPDTCWADSAFQECPEDGQAAYDYVMQGQGDQERHYLYQYYTNHCL